jgi:hypothetical protein
MAVQTPDSQDLTTYSRYMLFGLVLPLLIIAGFVLYIFPGQTENYFAWTLALPLTAAFLGAGYWSSIFHAFTGTQARGWSQVRVSMPFALAATILLAVTTFLHLDKFHLNSPLFITRAITWLWIIVYIVAPPILVIASITQNRLPGANVKGQNPLPAWIRIGFALLALIALLAGVGLFIAPEFMSTLWPWTITPLAARAIGAWVCAYGVACVSLVKENDVKFGAGTSTSFFAFCILQMIVVARFPAAIDWTRPLALGYMLFLVMGFIVSGSNVLANKRLSN